MCHALLSEWNPERSLRFANAAGAIVASRRARADDMPIHEGVEELVRRWVGV